MVFGGNLHQAYDAGGNGGLQGQNQGACLASPLPATADGSEGASYYLPADWNRGFSGRGQGQGRAQATPLAPLACGTCGGLPADRSVQHGDFVCLSVLRMVQAMGQEERQVLRPVQLGDPSCPDLGAELRCNRGSTALAECTKLGFVGTCAFAEAEEPVSSPDRQGPRQGQGQGQRQGCGQGRQTGQRQSIAAAWNRAAVITCLAAAAQGPSFAQSFPLTAALGRSCFGCAGEAGCLVDDPALLQGCSAAGDCTLGGRERIGCITATVQGPPQSHQCPGRGPQGTTQGSECSQSVPGIVVIVRWAATDPTCDPNGRARSSAPGLPEARATMAKTAQGGVQDPGRAEPRQGRHRRQGWPRDGQPDERLGHGRGLRGQQTGPLGSPRSSAKAARWPAGTCGRAFKGTRKSRNCGQASKTRQLQVSQTAAGSRNRGSQGHQRQQGDGCEARAPSQRPDLSPKRWKGRSSSRVMQWTHSAARNLGDFTTPELAAFFGIQLAFEINLTTQGLPLPTLLLDSRIDEDEDQGEDVPSVDANAAPATTAAGARTAMDSFSPVEPLSGWTRPSATPSTYGISFTGSCTKYPEESEPAVQNSGLVDRALSGLHCGCAQSVDPLRSPATCADATTALPHSCLTGGQGTLIWAKAAVRFSYAVQFWFPAAEQLVLPDLSRSALALATRWSGSSRPSSPAAPSMSGVEHPPRRPAATTPTSAGRNTKQRTAALSGSTSVSGNAPDPDRIPDSIRSTYSASSCPAAVGTGAWRHGALKPVHGLRQANWSLCRAEVGYLDDRTVSSFCAPCYPATWCRRSCVAARKSWVAFPSDCSEHCWTNRDT